jgi:hypothetical protein
MTSRRVSRPPTTQDTLRVPRTGIGVSEYRKERLQEELQNGTVHEGASYERSQLRKQAAAGSSSLPPALDNPPYKRGEWKEATDGVVMGRGRKTTMVNAQGGKLAHGAIAHSESYMKRELYKQASSIGVGSVGSTGSVGNVGAGVERLAPEVYSPLFVMANLNLPRDRITVNAWVRNYFQLCPYVRNGITLHATYPISKLNLKCHDKKVLQFFEDMIEEMGMIETLGDVSLEYWKIGETFPYAELDEATGKWSRIVIQNPDYVHVKKTVLSGDPIISLRPDATLQRLVSSSNPADIHLRQQIPEKVLYHVRNGQDIPLDNFNVSHLKMLASPYDVRGTSIIVSAFKDLMLFDKIRECFPVVSEVLTANGFKHYDEIGPEDRLATFNPETNALEFQHYTARIKKWHDGDVYHFHGKKVDVVTTPGHRMWMAQSKSHGGGYHDFGFIEAKDVKKGYFYKMRCVVGWKGKDIEEVDVLGHRIPSETYMKILGHLVAEGSIFYKSETYQYKVAINQCLDQDSTIFESVRSSMENLAQFCEKHLGIYDYVNTKGFSTNGHSHMRDWRIRDKTLAAHFASEIGTNSHNKHLPQWVKELSPRLLRILLDAAAEGDGTIKPSKFGTDSVGVRYTTMSKQLADDIQEIAFKCGYAPIVRRSQNGQGKWYWAVDWSNTTYGHFPTVYGNRKDKGNGGGGTFDVEHYSGEVFCFEVPNSLLVVRHNGHISIQGNCKFAQADSLINPITIITVGGSADGDYMATQEDIDYFKNLFEEAQYDKDFKVITHAGMDVKRVGATGAVLEVNEDFNFIVKNIYTALMIPPAVIDQESSVYASASIGLEVLRQRYFNFRAIMARWLVNKIFAPISDIQGYYEYKEGVKRLIVPEVEWNQMNLYDLQDYIENITGLVSAKQASLQTLYRSLGLNYQEERIHMRQEAIDDELKRKEAQVLATMTLGELRSLDPEKDILEPVDERGAREAPPEAGAPLGGPELGMPGGPPPGGGGLPGGMPELAPPPGGELMPPGGAGAPPGGGATPPLGPGPGPVGPGMAPGGAPPGP